MNHIERMDIVDVVNQISMNEKISWREKNGQAQFEKCPFCEATKQLRDSDQYKHFSVNLETGQYYCHHRNSCGAQGGFFSLKEQFGLNTDYYNKKSYQLPQQEKEGIVSDKESFYSWYEDKRGINKETLQKYRVELLKNGQGKYIVYNYIRTEGDLIFNRKYRDCSDKKKTWTEREAEKNFYGMHTVESDASYLIITEGEDDAHALSQMGLRNVVSLPYGAGTYTPSMHDYLSRFGSLYLCFDNDKAGQHGLKRFAEKAGLTRCFKLDTGNYKDARDAILGGEGKDFAYSMLEEASTIEHDSIYKLDTSLSDDLFDYISGQGSDKALYTPYWPLNKVLGGIRLQEFTLLTGNTGSGKTTFGYNMLHWVEQQGEPVMAFSFENKAKQISKKLIEIRSGKPTTQWDNDLKRRVSLVTREDINSQLKDLNESGWYFYRQAIDNQGYLDLEKFEKIVEYAYLFLNIRYFLVDHFHYMVKIKSKSNAVIEMEESVRLLRQVTQKFNCHLVVVAHPSKVGQSSGGKQNKVGLDSPKGTSALSQECDNFFSIERHGVGYSEVSLLKNREEGDTGTIYFRLESNNNLFAECFEDDPKEYVPDGEPKGFQ